MNKRSWIIAGLGLVALLVYLYMKQKMMVVTWLSSESGDFPKDSGWVYCKISEGHIVYVRECLNSVKGWDALLALWPLHLFLVIVSATSGVFGGCFFRDRYNAMKYEKKYRDEIQQARAQICEAKDIDEQSRIRLSAAKEAESAVTRQLKSIREKESDIEKIVVGRIQGTIHQLQSLQEDHKKRGAKVENMEKEKIELKRKNFYIEKELMKLQDENLELIKSLQKLKRGE
jgi:hypothetical protein